MSGVIGTTTVVIPGSQQEGEIQSPPAPVVEVVPKLEEKPQDPNSKSLEILARREAQIYKQRREADEQDKRLNEREERIKKYEDLETNKPDPVSLLQRYGYSYEDATNFILNNNKPTVDLEIKKVRDELNQLKKSTEDERQKSKDDAERQDKLLHEEATRSFKVEIHDFVADHPEEFELINLYESQNLIYNVITEHWQKQIDEGAERPRVLSTKDAAEMTEDYLEKLIEKALKTKKWASRFAGKVSAPKADEKTQSKSPVTSTQNTTLTNQMHQAAPSMLPAKNEQDRITRALAALEKQ